ncbi:MAG: DUF2207 domain-containing protein, partial [Methanomicrobiales archaeon]
MSELKQIVSLVIISLLVAAGVILLAGALPGLIEGDLVVGHYDAVLYENGTLAEHYDYVVKNSGEYRMLYRFWEAPLLTNPSDKPYLEFVSLTNPPGTTGYIKDAGSRVTIVGNGGDPAQTGKIQQLAELNEMGAFKPSYYDAGTYTLETVVIVHPPLEYDGQNGHLNIKLVDQHIPYRDIRIFIPAGYVKEVYPHPAHLKVEKSGDQILVTGSAAGDETVGIELLLSKDAIPLMDGYPVFVEDVAGKTRAANPWYNNLAYPLAEALRALGIAALVLTPFVFIGIFYRYGREKPFTVPKYLSFVPDPTKKPWVVNLLFKGDAMSFDEDGYYATLIDLHRRRIVRITEKEGEKGVTIALLEKPADDVYEQRVLGFLKDIAKDGVVDTAVIQELAQKAKTSTGSQSKILQYQRELSDVTRRVDPKLINEYIVDGRDHIIPVALTGVAFLALSVLLLIISPVLIPILVPAAFLWGGVVVLAGIAFAYPSTLFGHWKDDKYKEKLEWDAFAYFLSDLALIKQYSPSDISQWGDWLVYGTALGVGKHVEKAMNELNVHIPEAGVPLGLMHGAFVPIVAFSPPSQGGKIQQLAELNEMGAFKPS